MHAFSGLLPVDANVLAFDWMGRQVVTSAQGCSRSVLYLADIAAGRVEEWLSFDELVGVLSVDYGALAFDEDRFSAWRQAVGAGDAAIAFGDCVGYSIPLFLGGAPDVENLDLQDLAVYWTFAGQVYEQIRDSPAGMRLRDKSAPPGSA